MSHIPNDWTPPEARKLTALERAYRAISWTTDRLAERYSLTEPQREERAKVYEARAARWASMGKDYPSMLELAGLYTTAAGLMRDKD